MRQTSPAERDRGQRRVRSITIASAAGAGVLTLAGAAVAGASFGGRTVASSSSDTTQTTQTAPTIDPSGLQPPAQVPGDGSVPSGDQGAPVVSGGS